MQVKLKLQKSTDADILDHLSLVGNKQGYIKELIRNDIARSKAKAEGSAIEEVLKNW